MPPNSLRGPEGPPTASSLFEATIMPGMRPKAAPGVDMVTSNAVTAGVLRLSYCVCMSPLFFCRQLLPGWSPGPVIRSVACQL